MNISKKNILTLSGVLLALVLIWLGLSFYSVGRVANELNLMVSQPDPSLHFGLKIYSIRLDFCHPRAMFW